MKYLKKLIIYAVFILFQSCSYAYSCEIISPTFAIPSIVKKGNTLNIIFSAKQTALDFKAILLTEHSKKPLLINSTKFEDNNWQINTTIPKDVPIELYDLKIECSECSDIEERSIKIVEDYKDTFVFVHVTDTHIGVKGNEEVLAKVIEEINLINPEFVLITGDITSDCENVGRALMLKEGKKVSPYYTEKYKDLPDEKIKGSCINKYKIFLELLLKLRVPTYVIPGNHDMCGIYCEPCKEFYEEMIGKRYYSFDYGSYHFIGCDNSDMMEAAPIYYPNFKDELDDKQLIWLEEDLKKNLDKKLKFAFFHLPIYEKRCKFRELLEKYNVDMALAGHWHFDMIDNKGKPIWILTTSITAPSQVIGQQHRGYRIIKIKEGKIASYSYYGEYSIPYNELNYEFEPANDGKNYEVACRIKNELEQGFDNAQLKFIMPKDADYEIMNGELIQEVVTKNFKLIYVNINIPEEEEIEVIVRKR
ncbi:MAG: hypothetical protein COS84_04890 [Armatimonadetes bacterium CG07_land_8_20_14_0_80_40_9]|nr:MAG: hypothetical protein COS84_04890 [Armatimonadetes bacterium CG07_land_8_20_14_0_80_40_9]